MWELVAVVSQIVKGVFVMYRVLMLHKLRESGSRTALGPGSSGAVRFVSGNLEAKEEMRERQQPTCQVILSNYPKFVIYLSVRQ